VDNNTNIQNKIITMSDFFLLAHIAGLVLSNSTLFMALSAIAACFAAYYASQSAEGNHRSLKGNAIIEITKSESSTEMKEALSYLIDFSENFSILGDDLIIKFSSYKNSGASNPTFKDVNKYRRLIAQHHLMIYRLLNQNVIDKENLEDLLDCDQVKVLIEIIEPLHKEMGIRIHKKMYSFYENYYNHNCTQINTT